MAKKSYAELSPEEKAQRAAYNREWRRKNRSKAKASKKRYHAKHPEKMKAYYRDRYRRHKAKRLVYYRKRYAEHRERLLAEQKEYRTRNADKLKAYKKKMRITNRPSLMMYSVKKTAKAKGLAFDLDWEWFHARLEAGVCEMSGLPFDLVTLITLGGRGPNSPSVDRIDPKGGYTKNNCRMILWWLNRAMINLGEEYCLGVFREVFRKRREIAAPMVRAA